MTDLSANIVPHCSAIGLHTTGSLARGQIYEGTYRGRSLTVVCSRKTKTIIAGDLETQSYDGHLLSVHVGTSLKTRLGLGDESRGGVIIDHLNQRMGVEQIESLSPALTHLDIWASEPSWARQVMANQEINNMLAYLLPNQGPQSNAKVALGPESFEFNLKTRSFSPEQVTYWIDSVFRLIEALESEPAPLEIVELTALETRVKDNPKRAVFLLIGGIVAISFVLAGLLVGLAILLGSG